MEHVRLRAGLRRHVQRLDPPGLHELLRGAAVATRWSAPCSSRPTGCARPRSPRRTSRNQIDVVKEEIRVNVLNRPYGGFPWLTAAAGAVRDVPQRPQRLRRLRRPGERDRRRRRATSSTATTPRATPCWLSAATSTWTRPWSWSSGTSATSRPAHRPRPARLRRAGADLASGASEHVDPLAPAPAVALGWRVPDPVGDFDAYLPYVVLRRGAQRRRRLPAASAGWCRTTGSATDVGALRRRSGRPVRRARPDRAARRRRTTRPTVPADRVVARRRRGARPGRHRRRRRRRAGPGAGPADRRRCCRAQDHVLARTLALASFEQQRGRAELVGELPALLAAVTAEQVAAAAADAAPGRAGPPRHRAPAVPDEPARARRSRPARSRRLAPAAQAAAARRWPSGCCRTACGWSRCAGRACRWSRCGCGCRRPCVGTRTWRGPRCWSATMLLGTAERSPGRAGRGAAAARRLAVGSSGDADRLLLAGESLRTGLPELLRLLAEVLTGASYPTPPGRGRARPGWPSGSGAPGRSRACWPTRRWLRRMYGSHPYGREQPDADEVLAVPPASLRAAAPPPGACPTAACWCWSATSRRPGRSTRSAAALAGWDCQRRPEPGAGGAAARSRGRCCWSTGRARCSPTSGSAGRRRRAPTRRTPRCQLANMLFGGYFSSRLVKNIREDKGYTYSPRSAVRARRGRLRSWSIAADVATEVTAPALLETWYELGRMVSLPPTADEVAATAQYLVGIAGAVDRDPGRPGRDAVGAARRRAGRDLAARAPGRRWPR